MQFRLQVVAGGEGMSASDFRVKIRYVLINAGLIEPGMRDTKVEIFTQRQDSTLIMEAGAAKIAWFVAVAAIMKVQRNLQTSKAHINDITCHF